MKNYLVVCFSCLLFCISCNQTENALNLDSYLKVMKEVYTTKGQKDERIKQEIFSKHNFNENSVEAFKQEILGSENLKTKLKNKLIADEWAYPEMYAFVICHEMISSDCKNKIDKSWMEFLKRESNNSGSGKYSNPQQMLKALYAKHMKLLIQCLKH